MRRASTRSPSLARDGFFDRAADRRTCVLVTDGETPLVLAGRRGRRARRRRAAAVCWSCASAARATASSAPTASPEAGYRPRSGRGRKTRPLAEAAGGQAFSETTSAAAAALERAADVGPVGAAAHDARPIGAGPYAAALALVALASLLALRLGESVAPDPHGSVSFCGAARARDALFAALIVAVLVPVTASVASTSRTRAIPAGDWPAFGRTPDNSRLSPLTEITPANVSQLERVYNDRLPEDRPGHPPRPAVVSARDRRARST